MIKAVIFDCFGVVYLDKFSDIYTHFGGDLVEDRVFIEQTFFDASKGIIKSGTEAMANKLGVTRKEWDTYYDSVRDFNFELLDYTVELRNKYKISILSNVGISGLKNNLDYSVLEKYFDDIVESAIIGFAKPEARAYEIAADRLGTRLDECIFVDDREPYIEGAQHVGMKTILYKDFKSFKKELERVLA